MNFDEYKSSEEDEEDNKTGFQLFTGTFPKQEIIDSDIDFDDEFKAPVDNDEEFTMALYHKRDKPKKKKEKKIPLTNPVECLVCHKLLKNKKTLYNHKLTHTNIRPFKCNICTHAFKLNSFLKTHQKRHYIPGPFACELCKCFFKKKYKLDLHNQQIHFNSFII